MEKSRCHFYKKYQPGCFMVDMFPKNNSKQIGIFFWLTYVKLTPGSSKRGVMLAHGVLLTELLSVLCEFHRCATATTVFLPFVFQAIVSECFNCDRTTFPSTLARLERTLAPTRTDPTMSLLPQCCPHLPDLPMCHIVYGDRLVLRRPAATWMLL